MGRASRIGSAAGNGRDAQRIARSDSAPLSLAWLRIMAEPHGRETADCGFVWRERVQRSRGRLEPRHSVVGRRFMVNECAWSVKKNPLQSSAFTPKPAAIALVSSVVQGV